MGSCCFDCNKVRCITGYVKYCSKYYLNNLDFLRSFYQANFVYLIVAFHVTGTSTSTYS